MSGLSANIKTSWSKLLAIREHGILTFNETLQSLLHIYASFDNHNKLDSFKFLREGMSSNNQISMMMLAKEDQPYLLYLGTAM